MTAIASSTQLSADAGAQVAREGGNAVDVAIAASLVAATTEPGICSLGCGGFITIWPAQGDPITLDGNIEMPGRELDPARLGGGAWEVNMAYGGGVTTFVGHGSTGTPGGLAAYDCAWRHYGKLPWSEVLQPAIAAARSGFPMSPASHNYLRYSHECVYGWSPQSKRPLHRGNGELKTVGELIVVDDLAASLEEIATHGAASFYRGDLAQLIAKDYADNGGVMTATDLATYAVSERAPLKLKMNGWTLATNPAPAIGGASLAAMLELLKHSGASAWNEDTTALIADIQHRVLLYRFQHIDKSDALDADIRTLLDLAEAQAIPLGHSAPSTVHTSAVDRDGLACSITMSSGYGAGVMPPGTGIWMNNCLGEIELNRKGLNAGPPGMRLASNMAPTTARHADGHILAIGSPGADRITSALLCTLFNFFCGHMSLQDAIAHPRLHVDINNGSPRVAYEQGLDLRHVALHTLKYDELSMYFGGVGATLLSRDGDLTAAADPRRSGGHCVV